jgi:16S rRNA (cytosine1402-N4)-methyltransferase
LRKSYTSGVSARGIEHRPVLVEPLLRHMNPQPGQVVVDGTVGLGGHAAAILPRIVPGGRYIGIDIDAEMLAVARDRLAEYAEPLLTLFQGNYAEFLDVLARVGISQVDHVLVDLGVNSAQLDEPARGFSFDRDGPLDMRYDRTQKRQALDLVNSLSESELADVLYEYGQEGQSRKVARRICQIRHELRILTTRVLAQAVESVYGFGGEGGGRTHPATRVFQALRIAVNRELDNLAAFLGRAAAAIRPGGTLSVISFHSGEDGMVKRFLRAARQDGIFEEVTRRPEVADATERNANPRSRSAKLRVARRLGAA